MSDGRSDPQVDSASGASAPGDASARTKPGPAIDARFASVLATTTEAIVSVDADSRIVLFNDAAERMFGYPRASILGQPLGTLIPSSLRGRHEDHVRRFAGSGTTARRMGIGPVLRGLRRDGSEFPLDASISRAQVDGALVMTVIVRDMSDAVRSREALERTRAELYEVALLAQTAREEEKARLSRELHDELGQSLTALKLDLAWIQQRAATLDEKCTERVRLMQDILDSTVATTRRIASDLRPPMLDDLGLSAAIEWLARDFERRTGVTCELVLPDGLDALDPEVQSALYRATQEALTNITRHARARSARIDVGLDTRRVRLLVEDDGCGLQQGDLSKRGSFGLAGMRERVLLLGGRISIDGAPGGGTRVAVTIDRSVEARRARLADGLLSHAVRDHGDRT